jgi:hypothetical protein
MTYLHYVGIGSKAVAETEIKYSQRLGELVCPSESRSQWSFRRMSHSEQRVLPQFQQPQYSSKTMVQYEQTKTAMSSLLTAYVFLSHFTFS